jgi:geranylgeranyl pyrophosphate synthase
MQYRHSLMHNFQHHHCLVECLINFFFLLLLFLPPHQAATIAGADAPLVETAFLYGKNLGLAFQFVDDLLDFVSSSETMGKPAAADLKLGLATAPVLFACEKVRAKLKKS